MMKSLAILLVTALLLAGCQPTDEGIENQVDQQSQQDQQAGDQGTQGVTPIASEGGSEASALKDEAVIAREMLEQTDTPLASRIVYFEYDSARVSEDSMKLLQTHGEFIAGNGKVQVTLEGHADERGSREYNIALGDRRAQSVRRILLFQGASSDQVDSISYGEEKPAVREHDEAAWAKNRRVELVYEVR